MQTSRVAAAAAAAAITEEDEHPNGWICIMYLDRKMFYAQMHRRDAPAAPSPPEMAGPSWFDRSLNWMYETWRSRQRYIHVEVAFPMEHGETMEAFGVFADKGVFCQRRTFASSAYKSIFIACTPDERRRCRDFCAAQVGKPMDVVRAYLSAVWPTPPPLVVTARDEALSAERGTPATAYPAGWWCSALTSAALQEIGMLQHYRYYELDVDDLVLLLKASKRRRQGVLTNYELEHVPESAATLWQSGAPREAAASSTQETTTAAATTASRAARFLNVFSWFS